MKKAKPLMSLSYINQPNRITEAHYDYSLVQKKIFASVMFYLQQAIKERQAGRAFEQLQLFSVTEGDTIQIKIPLRNLTPTKTNYDDVRRAAEQLVTVAVRIPIQDPETGRRMLVFRGLMAVAVDDDKNARPDTVYDKHITIEVHKQVVKRLIEIEQNEHGIPINYTRLGYEIVMSSKKKYTPRIYEMICSWKKKGFFTTTIEEFKARLGLAGKYPRYDTFKDKVIRPAYRELFEAADCWFDCEYPGFETREGQAVTHLNFKVISLEDEKVSEVKREKLKEILRVHFRFREEHFEAIADIISNPANLDRLSSKLVDLNGLIYERKGTHDQIEFVPGYTVSSIKNLFAAGDKC